MKKNKNWFSLSELMTVIIIVWILFFAVSKITFKSQIDNQNAHLLVNTIYGNIETVRNNSLLWKWISSGSTLIHPSKWVIKLDTIWSGHIIGYYSTGWSLAQYGWFWNFSVPNSQVQELKCINMTNSTLFHTGTQIDIEMVGSTITFSWCTAPNNGILDIKLRHASTFKIIRMNTVTGLMQKIN